MRSISSFKLHLAGLKTWWYQGRRQFAYRIMIATISIHFDRKFPQALSKLNKKVKCAPKYEIKNAILGLSSYFPIPLMILFRLCGICCCIKYLSRARLHLEYCAIEYVISIFFLFIDSALRSSKSAKSVQQLGTRKDTIHENNYSQFCQYWTNSILKKYFCSTLLNKITQILWKIEFFGRVITCFRGEMNIEFVYVLIYFGIYSDDVNCLRGFDWLAIFLMPWKLQRKRIPTKTIVFFASAYTYTELMPPR